MRNEFEVEPQNFQPQNIEFRSFLSLLYSIFEILRFCGSVSVFFYSPLKLFLPFHNQLPHLDELLALNLY